MKPNVLFLLALGLIDGPSFAGPIKFTLHGGAAAQTNALVTFNAPKEWKGQHVLRDQAKDRMAVVQIDDSGKAVMIVDQIGQGETRTFTSDPNSLVEVSGVGIAVEKEGSRLKATYKAGSNPSRIFDYQMEAGPVPVGVSEVFKHGAHLHPVYSPGGHIVTGNHPADHRWHRGIWMAWTKTEFEGEHPDFWNQGKGDGKDKSSDQILAEVRFDSLVKTWSGPVQGGFVSKHRFIDHNSGTAKNVLDETWEVSVYAPPQKENPVYILDLVSTQTCSGNSPLKLPIYHYGGLGVRGSEAWNPVDKVTMLTSNGDDRKKGDSTKAKWVQMGGDVDGQPTGMAILIHPDNFRFPQPLRLNPKNPQLCIAPSQDGDWSIEPGKPYVSRYRFLISDGPADAQAIEAAWQAYAHPLKVTLD